MRVKMKMRIRLSQIWANRALDGHICALSGSRVLATMALVRYPGALIEHDFVLSMER